MVYSVVGNPLLEVQFNTSDEIHRVETSKLNPGIYFVSIRLDTGEFAVDVPTSATYPLYPNTPYLAPQNTLSYGLPKPYTRPRTGPAF